MDTFDEAILAVLKDGRGRSFNQILEEVDFSRSNRCEAQKCPQIPKTE